MGASFRIGELNVDAQPFATPLNASFHTYLTFSSRPICFQVGTFPLVCEGSVAPDHK
jgi:hypothetical protein